MLSSDELAAQNSDSGSVPGKWYECGGVIPSMRMLSNIVLRCRRTRNVCYIDQIFKYKNHFLISRLMKNEFCLSLILPESSILPVTYIYSRFQKFFAKYSITSTSIILMIHDENEFLLLRRQLLYQATINEHRRAARIAKTMDYNNFPPTIDPLVKEKLLKRRERTNSILIHYTHEKRFSHYKRAIHQIWNNTFHNTPIEKTKLIVGNRNNQGCQVIATVNVNNSENSENGVDPSDTDGNPGNNPNLSKELNRRNPFINHRNTNNKKSTKN